MCDDLSNEHRTTSNMFVTATHTQAATTHSHLIMFFHLRKKTKKPSDDKVHITLKRLDSKLIVQTDREMDILKRSEMRMQVM